MGLLDIFKRREKTFNEKWRKETRWMYHSEGHYDQSIPEELLVEFFNETGKYLEKHSIHLHYSKPVKSTNDPPAELRGFYMDFPVRVLYAEATYEDTYVTYNGNVSIEVKAEYNPEIKKIFASNLNLCNVRLWRDPDKIPVDSNPDDPWNSEDLKYIFIGKGIFFSEYTDSLIQMNLELLNSISENLRSKIVETMDFWSLESMVFDYDKISITLGLDNFHSLKDPVQFVLQGLDLVCRTAGELQAAAVRVDKESSGIESHQVMKAVLKTCRYCTTKFVLTEKCSCPNCGAAFTE